MYQRIYNNYKSLTIVTVIIVSVLEWIRYIVRMAGTGTVQKLLEDKGERKKGRPRKRCIDEDDFDLRNMAVKKWRTRNFGQNSMGICHCGRKDQT